MKLVYKFFLGLTNIVFPSKIKGKENIPEGGAIFVYNHLSLLDPFFVIKAYKKDDLNILAKIELFEKKFSAKIMRAYGGIPITREKPELGSLLKAVRILKDGHKLALSPEGTRNKSGSTEMLQFKAGAVVLAVKAKCPIVPFIVSKRATPFSRTNILIGKPFTLEQFYDKRLDDSDLELMSVIIRENMENTQKLLYDSLNKKRKK